MSITREFNIGAKWHEHTGVAKLDFARHLKTHMRVVMPNHDRSILECQVDDFHFSDADALNDLPYPVRITAQREVA